MAEKVAETFLQRRATWLFTSRLCSALTEITPDNAMTNLRYGPRAPDVLQSARAR